MIDPFLSAHKGLALEDFVRQVAPHLLGPNAELAVHEPLAPRDLGVDIVVSGLAGDEVALIEVRGDTPATRSRLEFVVERLQRAAELIGAGRDVRFVLASPGLLSDTRLHILEEAGVEYWNGLKLVRAAREVDVRVPDGLGLPPAGVSLEKPPEMQLSRRIRNIPSGRKSWPAYQSWCRDVLDYLFHPPLNEPIYESATKNRHNRRDIVLANYADKDFWHFMRVHYQADYVVVDAKNSAKPVKKASVLQLANYLSSHGTGLFGIMMCRKGAAPDAEWAIREQWVLHRKMIVVLDDADVAQMFGDKQSGANPEALIRQKIEDFRLGI